MATTSEEPKVEDIYPVRSRVSWGAILAGAVIALAMYLVLTLFSGAIGLTLSTTNIREGTLGVAALIAAVFCAIVSLFVGGLVTTQLAVGENKREGLIHGVLMWGVVLALLFGMTAVAAQTATGFGALLVSSFRAPDADVEAMMRRAGVTDNMILEWRRQQEKAREGTAAATSDPDKPPAERRDAAIVAWWTLGAFVLSLAAAIGGALLGSGPTFQLVALRPGRIRVSATPPAR